MLHASWTGRRWACHKERPSLRQISYPMSRVSALACVVMLAASAGPAVATDDARAYSCRFTVGAAHAHAAGRFKPTKAGPVTLDIANVDHARQEAELVSGERRSSLRIIRAVNAVHFLDAVGEGYLNITTIYDRDAGSVTYPAVHSRHFGLLGQPIVSQYRGSCIAKG